ncbi:DUF4865 domain-containing protein [Chelatococcus reniformis]|uniref:DUF4865 domain-containing protein n=2 Tax=Chelatococcus reniformis TaxID=1494448 RepID=A0A916XQQ4_9HYPH|nr:DUF4865 domain-containing protein [Chelatococcus reniformis]
MIIAHYAHRLPAQYDLDALRRRSKERAAVWDVAPELYFKAFLLRETGRFGAIANSFSSLYLWRQDKALRDWLMRGGYEVVTQSFGRAEIETFFALDAFRGRAGGARFLYRNDVAVRLDADLTAAFAAEVDLARTYATAPDVRAAIVGLDPRHWRFVRVVLSEAELDGSEFGAAYQIAHLSSPLLDTLPSG